MKCGHSLLECSLPQKLHLCSRLQPAGHGRPLFQEKQTPLPAGCSRESRKGGVPEGVLGGGWGPDQGAQRA